MNRVGLRRCMMGIMIVIGIETETEIEIETGIETGIGIGREKEEEREDTVIFRGGGIIINRLLIMRFRRVHRHLIRPIRLRIEIGTGREIGLGIGMLVRIGTGMVEGSIVVMDIVLMLEEEIETVMVEVVLRVMVVVVVVVGEMGVVMGVGVEG